MIAHRVAEGFIQDGDREQTEGRYVAASTAYIAAGNIFERLNDLTEAEDCYRSAATALDRAADKVAMAHERQERTL